MSVAYIGLLALVAATPVLLFFDNPVVGGAIQLYAAIGMTIIAVGMRPGEARHFFKLIRVPLALGAIPLAWMLLQLLPMPLIGGLSRSIWESAAGGLNTPLLAHISIDPGLTLVALCRFASMVGIAFVAAAVSIERQQAEKLHLALAGAAVVISLTLLARQIDGSGLLDESGAGGVRASVVTAGIIGIILIAASMIMIIERYETGRHHQFLSRLAIPTGIMMAGFLVCSLTLVPGDTSNSIFAVSCGGGTVVIIYFVRKIGLGPRAGLTVSCVAVVGVAAIIWTKGHPIPGDISLRYMNGATANVVSLDSRIVDDVGFGGSGAGTFRAISLLYGMQESSDSLRPSTFAAQIAIELGRPALWTIVGLGCAFSLMCARSAFSRGRDFFYPLAGAGVTIAMVLNSFSNAGLATPAISILVAATLGLGFAQSVSRSALGRL